MTKDININVENKFLLGKRDINVYHHSSGKAHMLRYNNYITLPLKLAVEEDYLYISIVMGPGHLENKSVVNLPSWADFEFSSRGNATLIHSGDRILLKIPPGPPVWQLRMTRSLSSSIDQPSDFVTIGDDLQEYR